MDRKKLLVGLLLLSVLFFTTIALQQINRESSWFEEYPSALNEAHRFFDIGVVDANGDNLLDIYTSNHNFSQVMLIAD